MAMNDGGDHAIAVSEDNLLLREFAHRTANEIAASAATMRIALSGRRRGVSGPLLRASLDRLESFGELHKLLARPIAARGDAGALIERICRTFAVGHGYAARGKLLLDVAPMPMGGGATRRLALVAAELVRNAVKYALAGRQGIVRVVLRRLADDVVLSITDDGPGFATAAPAGTGWGRGIVADLVALSGGTLTIDTGPHGTSITVVVPADQDGDDALAF